MAFEITDIDEKALYKEFVLFEGIFNFPVDAIKISGLR